MEGSFSRGRVRVDVCALCGSYGLYGGRGGTFAVSGRYLMSWRFVSSSLLSPFRAPFRLARRSSHRMERDDADEIDDMDEMDEMDEADKQRDER